MMKVCQEGKFEEFVEAGKYVPQWNRVLSDSSACKIDFQLIFY